MLPVRRALPLATRRLFARPAAWLQPTIRPDPARYFFDWGNSGKGDSPPASGGDSGSAPASGSDAPGDGHGGSSDPTPAQPVDSASAEQLAEGGDDSSAVATIGVGEKAPRPGQLLALPVRRPIFPWFIAHIATKDPAMIKALQSIRKSRTPYVALFCEKRAEEPHEDVSVTAQPADALMQVGTMASLQSLMEIPDGGVGAWFLAHRRVQWLEQVSEPQTGLPPMVAVKHIDRAPGEANTDMVRALSNEILYVIRSLVKSNPMMKEQMQYFMQRLEVRDPYKLADFAAAMTNAGPAEAQAVLEAAKLEDRLQAALALLQKEQEIAKMQAKISSQVDEAMKESQRKYFLHEQLKSIKKELGLEKDDKEALQQKFEARLEDLTVPEHIRQVLDEEFAKLSVLEKNSSEFNVTRSYLDWLTALPWGKFSEDAFDLRAARQVLDKDHYGMSDVKERILEFIAIGKLKGSVQGKIMCLVGPPGVGKTSIGKSIAESLGRQFYRFSVGGLNDVAEIKGHRRTYVGAMPGKLIQCLKATHVSNPMVLIDEIDKIGTGKYGGGDPASALLEMLDPSQNKEFMDHFLDVPVDASKVLFLCTANSLDTIPGPLLDRMEVIHLSGYDGQEKLHIAKRYLEPKVRAEVGLADGDEATPPGLKLTDDAIQSLVRWYARESGVRNLEKLIGKIYRKVALEVVQRQEGDDGEPVTDDKAPDTHAAGSIVADAAAAAKDAEAKRDWTITPELLQHYVGKRRFNTDRLYEQPPAGVIMGLAWSSMGGSALYIECSSAARRKVRVVRDEDKLGSEEAEDKYSGSLKLTGKMGDVMQESAAIAHTLARRFIRDVPGQESNDFLEQAAIHMHVPEGATPKDGPSAGVTMTTALLSLAMDRPARADLAMTGEVTLTGRVLAVGGIREKTQAAKRAGISTVVLPAACSKDWDELPGHVTEGMTVHFAEQYSDVFKIAFGESE